MSENYPLKLTIPAKLFKDIERATKAEGYLSKQDFILEVVRKKFREEDPKDDPPEGQTKLVKQEA